APGPRPPAGLRRTGVVAAPGRPRARRETASVVAVADGGPGAVGRRLGACPSPPAYCRRAGRGRLAGLRRARVADALPVAGHRAPLRLGQREPAAVRPAVP